MIQGEHRARCAADVGHCRRSHDDVLVVAVLRQHLARVTSGEGIAYEEEQEYQAETSNRPDANASRYQERSLHD
jgi:hypothetical protein